MNTSDNPITQVIAELGLGKMASHLGVSYQAIRKWEKAGRFPRTEWTGETHYAEKLEILTEQKFTKQALLQLPGASSVVSVETET